MLIKEQPFQTTTLIWLGVFALSLNLVIGGLWTILLITNIKTTPMFPWAVLLTATILWLLWQYLNGRWTPAKTSGLRHYLMRANALPKKTFVWALIAGLFSIMSLAGFWIIMVELAKTPGNATVRNFSARPLLITISVLTMASFLSAIIEEITIRGYFQKALESRMPGMLAIFVAALIFSPVHSLTQGFVWTTLVFYLFADMMFGAIAHLTDSILPGVIVHTSGLVVFFTLIWPYDSTRRLISQGGPIGWFWLHAAQTIVFAIAAILVFTKLKGLSQDRKLESLAACKYSSWHS